MSQQASRRSIRLILSLSLILVLGHAVAGAASAEDFQIIRSKYKVWVTGQYVNDWQGQTSGFPDPRTPWSTETGNITSGFSTPGGIRFVGTRFKGDLPGTTKLPKFQWSAAQRPIAKAKNRQKFKRKINYVPACGGELGECDGTEPSGVKATARSCRLNKAKIPLEFEFDQDGHRPAIRLGLGQHDSMLDFCGKKYPAHDSIDHLPPPFTMPEGLDAVMALGKGEKLTRVANRERGWIGGDGHPQGARNLKQCPQMSGVGSRQCWITHLRLEIKRIR